MVAPAAPMPAAEPTYGIRVAGRLYPPRLRPQSDLPLLERERERNGVVAVRMLEGLPWRTRSLDEFANLSEIVKCYEDSLRLLELRHQEVSDLLWEVCQRNLTVQVSGFSASDPRIAEVESRLTRQRFEQAAFKHFKPDSVLSAELLANSMQNVHSRLNRSLEQTTHRVVQSTFEAMDRLVDRSVLGVIDWTSDSVCKFHFFKEASQYRREATHAQQSEIKYMEDEWKVEETTITNTQEVESRTRSRHEHHLMDAERVEIRSDAVVVPIAIQPIIDKIPAWLAPEAKIVTGQQFREDIIEQQCQKRVWLKEYIKTRKIRTHFDPAVVIGHFVLTGWGEQETLEEASRRHTITSQATRQEEVETFGRGHRRATMLARGLGVASLVAMALGVVGSSAMVLLAMICLCLSLWQTTTALQNAARYYRVKPDPGYLAAGVAGMACLWVGWMIAIPALLWGVPLAVLAGIGLSFLTRPLLKVADSWLPGPLFSIPKS